MALLLIVPLAAPVMALPIGPCRMNPDGTDDCALAEAWDYYGVTILARQNVVYANLTQSGATYDQPMRPVASARFNATEQTVDFLTFRATSARTGDYYERGPGGTLTKKGSINLDDRNTIVVFRNYLDTKMGLHPQVQDGRWRDLLDGLRAGASESATRRPPRPGSRS